MGWCRLVHVLLKNLFRQTYRGRKNFRSWRAVAGENVKSLFKNHQSQIVVAPLCRGRQIVNQKSKIVNLLFLGGVLPGMAHNVRLAAVAGF